MVQLITFIWRFRLNQIWRIRLELGLARTVILLLPAIYVFLKIWLWPLADSMEGAILHTALILAWHFRRQDRLFIRRAHQHPALWYSIEYLSLAVLSLGPGLASEAPVWAILPLGIALLAPWIPQPTNISTAWLKLGRWVPAYLFEWKAGMNQRGIWIVAGWIAALLCAGWTVSVPLFMLAWPILMADWYQPGQPMVFLQAWGMKGRDFLHQKIKLHLGAYTVVCAPLMLSFLLLHASYWYVLAYAYITMCILLSLYICLYYSLYSPNEAKSEIAVLQGFAWICTFIPFFIPVPLVMLIQRYGRARLRLHQYLPDYVAN